MSTVPPAPPVPTPPARRLRRRWFWVAVGGALALIVVGTVVAVLAFEDRADPAATARSYFAAVARADAPAALGYGDLPDGDRSFLTSDVLRAQRRTAAISRISVVAVERSGARATATVQYALGFADGSTVVSDRVNMIDRDGRWRLTPSAVALQLNVSAARHRMTLAGASVPTSTVALFPGALPLTLDTPALNVSADSRTIRFVAGTVHAVDIGVSPAGRAAVQTAVDGSLRACLAGTARPQALCPLPADTRAIPGTLRSTKPGQPSASLSFRVTNDSDGQIAIDGQATVTGSYTTLSFDNVAQTKTGSTPVTLHGQCYASTPQTIVWRAT